MNSPRFRYAFEYAAAIHAADLRKGAKIPYLSHLLEVCAIVMRYGGNEDAVIAALLAMRIAPGLRDNDGRSVFERLNEGLDYVTRSVPIRSILLLMALISFMGLPYIILMPVFTSVVLGGGPETLGFLMGATGMGAFTGALMLALYYQTAAGPVIAPSGSVCGREPMAARVTKIMIALRKAGSDLTRAMTVSLKSLVSAIRCSCTTCSRRACAPCTRPMRSRRDSRVRRTPPESSPPCGRPSNGLPGRVAAPP